MNTISMHPLPTVGSSSTSLSSLVDSSSGTPSPRRPLRDRCNVALHVDTCYMSKPKIVFAYNPSLLNEDLNTRTNALPTNPASSRKLKRKPVDYSLLVTPPQSPESVCVNMEAANREIKKLPRWVEKEIVEQSVCPPERSLTVAPQTGPMTPPDSPSTNVTGNPHKKLCTHLPSISASSPCSPASMGSPKTPRTTPLKVSAKEPELSPNALAKIHQLHELIPGLYLAFSDSHDASGNGGIDKLRTWDEKKFTHIIRVSYDVDLFVHGTREQCLTDTNDNSREEEAVHLLRLCTTGRADCPAKNHPTLTPIQLLAARDFLSLAMPYTHPDEEYQESHGGDEVQVLIVAPQDFAAPTNTTSRADILAIAVCYLAFASGNCVETVLQYIQEEEEVNEIWRGVQYHEMEHDNIASDLAREGREEQRDLEFEEVITREGLSLIERIARV